MPKHPHKDIDAPGPTRGKRQDVSALKERLKGTVTFHKAKRPYDVPPEDTREVLKAGMEWSRETGTPFKSALTMAWRCYWELHDERDK